MDGKQVYTYSGSGLSFTGVLTIVFIVLKLCNVITWSWWWVISPLWIGILSIPVALIIGIIFICLWTFLVTIFKR